MVKIIKRKNQSQICKYRVVQLLIDSMVVLPRSSLILLFVTVKILAVSEYTILQDPGIILLVLDVSNLSGRKAK